MHSDTPTSVNSPYNTGTMAKGVGAEDAYRTQEQYDTWANTYDADVSKHEYRGPKYMLELCQKYVPKNALILNVGTGTGIEASLLFQAGYTHLHGHDGSANMLAIAQQRRVFEYCNAELLLPDAQSSFESDHYDALVCLGCFVPGGLDTRHIADLMRAVKLDGVLVVGTREVFVTDPGAPFNYPYVLDKTLCSLQDQGKLKLLERLRVSDYTEHLFTDQLPAAKQMPGVFYVLKKVS